MTESEIEFYKAIGKLEALLDKIEDEISETRKFLEEKDDTGS